MPNLKTKTSTGWQPLTVVAYDATEKENVSNKVTSMSASSTNTQYPSAKSVYDEVSAKADKSTTYTKTEVNTALEAKENLGKITIDGTEYTVRIGTSGAAGYITFAL